MLLVPTLLAPASYHHLLADPGPSGNTGVPDSAPVAPPGLAADGATGIVGIFM
jgi:hypothetical protein